MLFMLVSVGVVVAQDVPETDSLAIATVDTLAIRAFLSDSLAVDSAVVAPKKEPPFKTRIKYKAADSVKFNIPNQRVYMYKETQTNYEDMELKAFKTEFDLTSKIVYAKGGRDSLGLYLEAPHMKNGNDEYDADSLSFNFDTKKGIIHEIKTKQGEGYLHATKAKRYADGHIDIGGGIYTTCDADHPHFGLRLKEGKVIPGSQTIFRIAWLELLDIPLKFMMLPFGFFPQTNKESVSGIIPPTIGMEISRGLSLTNGGYYFAFNDHIDAQIMGDIFSSGTWRTQLTSRYLKRYKFSGDLTMSYGVSVSGEKGLDLSKQKQYSVVWSHRQDAKANPNHNFSANVNYSTSSYDKQFNYMNSTAVYNNQKSSNISFSQNWPNTPFRFSTNFRANQTMGNSEKPGRIAVDFPNFTFGMNRIYPFRKKESTGKAKWYEDIALQYDASMQNTLEGNEGELFDDKNLKNMKNGYQHRIPFSITFKALKNFNLNITPSMNYTGAFFTKQIRKTYDPDAINMTIVNNDTTITRGRLETDTLRGLFYAHALAPTLSVQMAPKFFLMNTYGPNSKVEAIRTMISPTVGVSYVPDLSRFFNYHKEYTDANGKVQDYDIFQGMGAYGTPTPSRRQTGSVNFQINGNVEMKVRSLEDSTVQSKKIKILNNISAGTSYNIFGDSYKWSNINLSANTTVWVLNLQMGGRVDPYKLTPAGTRIEQFGPRLIDMNFNTGLSLPLEKKEAKKEGDKNSDPYSYFDVPWNLSVTYGLTYLKDKFDGKLTQNMSFSGNVNFTKKWSLNFSSQYDFDAKKISTASAGIQRDLHCWQMSFNFSPFGPYKYFNFLINVKSSTLKDLKYEQKKSSSDFSRQPW